MAPCQFKLSMDQTKLFPPLNLNVFLPNRRQPCRAHLRTKHVPFSHRWCAPGPDPFRSPLRCHSLPETSQEQEPAKPQPGPEPSGFPLLPTSVGFYGAMTVASIALGKNYKVLDQLTSPLDLQSTLPYLGAMFGLFLISTALAEVLPSFKELKVIYQRTLIPQLQTIPLWGLAVMALGAGVGEEALFRGVLQPWIAQLAAGAPGTSPVLAVGAGVVAASVLFGAAHSITASYFIFATTAGAIFGIEYLNCGLPAAVFTHALYDFLAFIAVIQLWGERKPTTKT